MNAYGRGKWDEMPSHELWGLCNVAQKTGAIYATELCSDSEERRGVGINRWLQSQIQFAEYCKAEKTTLEICMKPDVVNKLFKEIDALLPAMKAIMAPKKEHKKDGVDALRGSVADGRSVVSDTVLNEHAKTVWDFINPAEKNVFRATQFLFGGGGSSHVASSHHRAMLGFVLHGNALHQQRQGDAVTLEEFQAALRARHHQGPVDEEEPPHKKIKAAAKPIATGFM